MAFEINDDLGEYTPEELSELIGQGNEILDELFGLQDPTDEQITEAEGVISSVASLEAEQASRQQAADDRVSRMQALRESRVVATEQPAEEDEAEEDEEEEEPEPAPQAEVEEPAPVAAAVKKPKVSPRQALAKTVKRPVVPVRESGRLVITAAADVPDFPTGGEISDIDRLSTAVLNRMRGFPQPAGIQGGQMQNFAVASFRLPFEDEFVIDRGKDDQEVIEYAAKESRLPGGSLVASGGWCAPSETLYDFCSGASTDGLVDLPEVNAQRGGIRYTPGPDFSTLYNNIGFCQTEAQAIAGTAKTCYEVTCPAFTETRLDACGVCIKVPILTQAAYPELVSRVLSDSLIVHQHKMSVKAINAMVAAAGTAAATGDQKATSTSTLDAVELLAITLKQSYRLGYNETLEVVAPFWLKSAIRADLAARGGVDLLSVTDAQIDAYFAVRNVNVQWVYNWQALPTTATTWGYPSSVQVLVYPAGTFIKATSNVINLSAVYDAAELSVNRYTGLFFEQGIAIIQRCYQAKLATIPVCAAGAVGAAQTACFTTAP